MDTKSTFGLVAGAAAFGAAAGYLLAKQNSSSSPLVVLDDRNKKGGPGYHYNKAQVHNGVVYASGQVAVKLLLTGNKKGGSVKEETKETLENLAGVLKESGSDLSKVMKTTCYLGDISYYGEFNEVYAQFFEDNGTKPARVCFAAGALPLGAKVEVECTAYI
jgi:2-iminobutanoate/2-iminopropanoate deaminase